MPRLTNADVDHIRLGGDARVLANKFGVSSMTIYRIRNGGNSAYQRLQMGWNGSDASARARHAAMKQAAKRVR
jgi:hypothetical protein